MHPAFANPSSAWLIKALNTAAVSHQESHTHSGLVTQQDFYIFTTASTSVPQSKGKF